MKVLYFTAIWVLIYAQSCLLLPAQTPIKLYEISLPALPTCISANVSEGVYVAEGKGVIRQYDSTGRQVMYYSPTNVAEVTALEARFGRRVFAFYQDTQSFTTFNRFLQPIESHRLNSDKIGFAQTVAWNADQTLWIWDSQDMTLKKYNPLTEEIMLQTNLVSIAELQEADIDIVAMQGYENRLYVFDRQGRIWVFDYFGIFLQRLSYPTHAYLYAEKIWTVDNQQLLAYPLYETNKAIIEKRIAMPLPSAASPLFLYINQRFCWFFEAKKLLIWRL